MKIALAICAAILGAIIVFSNVQVSESALTNKFALSVSTERNPLSVGDYPTIIGSVRNEAYKPVEGANVMLSFSSVTATVTTDALGNFRYTSTVPATQGIFAVNIVVTKDGFYKGLASTTYTALPKSTGSQLTYKTVTGLPLTTGNYTVYLGKVEQWNLETTCFVSFGDKYMRFLKTCDLYNMVPQYFQSGQPMIPMVTVISYDNQYRLFSDEVYNSAFNTNSTGMSKLVTDVWQNYTSP